MISSVNCRFSHLHNKRIFDSISYRIEMMTAIIETTILEWKNLKRMSFIGSTWSI